MTEKIRPITLSDKIQETHCGIDFRRILFDKEDFRYGKGKNIFQGTKQLDDRTEVLIYIEHVPDWHGEDKILVESHLKVNGYHSVTFIGKSFFGDEHSTVKSILAAIETWRKK